MSITEPVTRTLTCEVSPGSIKAALYFAGVSDVRSYLNGACIDHTPTGTRMIATDGHRLIIVNIDSIPVTGDPVRYVIARDVLDSIIRGFSKLPLIRITWQQTNRPDPERDGVTIVGRADITLHGIPTVDVQDTAGNFPDYRKIIPEHCSGKTAQFNVDYLSDCGKARKALGAKDTGPLFIAHNGDKAALVELSASAFALVMPMRGEVSMTPPAWANEAMPTQAEAA